MFVSGYMVGLYGCLFVVSVVIVLLLYGCFKVYTRRDFWRVGGCCAVVVSGWSLVGLVGWLGCMQLAVSRVRVGWSLGLVSVGSFSCDLGTFRGWCWVVGRVGWFRAIVGRVCASCGTFAGWVGWWFVRGGRGRQASRVVVCGVGVRSLIIATGMGSSPHGMGQGEGCGSRGIEWCKHSIFEKKKKTKNEKINFKAF